MVNDTQMISNPGKVSHERRPQQAINDGRYRSFGILAVKFFSDAYGLLNFLSDVRMLYIFLSRPLSLCGRL